MKRDAFTSKQASYLTGCTSHQLRYWDKVNLVSPSIQSSNGKPGVPKLYSFRDIVSLRVVKTLLDNGMSIQRVRRAWKYLSRNGNLVGQLSEVKLVSDGVNELRSENRSMLIITHYQRLLNYIQPDHVHVLAHGKIQRSGGKELALELEAKGYAEFSGEAA